MKKYVVLMMHPLYPINDMFYKQLYIALKEPVVATILHNSAMKDDSIKEMIEDAVGSDKDVVPVLVYYDNYFNEEMVGDPSTLVNVASIASIVTGNIAITASYDYIRKYEKVRYTFSL